MKFSAQTNHDKIDSLNKKILDNYKTWCAASTHNGEEIIILKTHMEIKNRYNKVLTIIVPRHVNRSLHIKNLSKKFNLNVQILNDNLSL